MAASRPLAAIAVVALAGCAQGQPQGLSPGERAQPYGSQFSAGYTAPPPTPDAGPGLPSLACSCECGPDKAWDLPVCYVTTHKTYLLLQEWVYYVQPSGGATACTCSCEDAEPGAGAVECEESLVYGWPYSRQPPEAQ